MTREEIARHYASADSLSAISRAHCGFKGGFRTLSLSVAREARGFESLAVRHLRISPFSMRILNHCQLPGGAAGQPRLVTPRQVPGRLTLLMTQAFPPPFTVC